MTRSIELACEACKEAGKAAECVHMLHLVPSWQSAERHRKLKIMVSGVYIQLFCVGGLFIDHRGALQTRERDTDLCRLPKV